MKKTHYLPLLLVVVLLAIWPFSFFQFIPKWDNLDAYLPYKYFLSDNLWNGHWPWWNPYMNLGYPAYSELQNGIWNPIVWGLMLFGKYTTVSLVIEMIIYFIICAIGSYKLSGLFVNQKSTKYIIALSYSLSGFMIDSNQLMVFIMGYAWFPSIIYAIIKFQQTNYYKYALLAAVLIALQITSASPAYTIILFYILLGYIISTTFKKWRKGTISRKLVGGYVLPLFVLLALILPYILSFIDFAPYFNRTGKLPYDNVLLSGSFDFAEYISFIFPYAVVSETDIFGATPPSLRNGYFGIFLLVILLFSLIKLRNKTIWILTLLGIFSLLLAAGDYTPVYKIFYYLPGFGLFKHLSIFRGYAILCFILAAGIGLEQIISKNLIIRKEYVGLFGTIFLLVFLSTTYAFYKSSPTAITENLIDLIRLKEFPRGGIYTSVFINGVIISGLLGIYLLSIFLKKWNQQKLLIILISLDVFLMFQLSTPSTLINPYRLHSHVEGFAKLPNKINQKPATIPLKELSEGDFHINSLWRNKSTYSKTVFHTGYNPTRFNSYLELESNGGLTHIIENPIFYIPYNQIKKPENIKSKPNLGWNIPETLTVQKETMILSSEIGYNSFTVNVNNPAGKSSLVALSQNYHHLWKATIDGKPVKIHKINDGIMGVTIPPFYTGKIYFSFSPSIFLKISFFVSLLGYMVILCIIFRINRKKTMPNQ